MVRAAILNDKKTLVRFANNIPFGVTALEFIVSDLNSVWLYLNRGEFQNFTLCITKLPAKWQPWPDDLFWLELINVV